MIHPFELSTLKRPDNRPLQKNGGTHMWRASRCLLVLLALACFQCDKSPDSPEPPPPPKLTVELHNLAYTHHDGPRAAFWAEGLPVVWWRLDEGSEDAIPSLSLTTPDQPPAPLKSWAYTHGEWYALRAAEPPDYVGPATLTLTLERPDKALPPLQHSWPTYWDLNPKTHPKLEAAGELLKSEETWADGLTQLRALATSDHKSPLLRQYAWRRLGRAFLYRNDLQEAYDAWLAGARQAELEGYPIFRVLRETGVIHVLNKMNRAAEALEIATRIVEDPASLLSKAHGLYSRSSLFRQQGRFQQAQADAVKSAGHYLSLGLHMDWMHSRVEQAIILAYIGDHEQSLKTLRQTSNTLNEKSTQNIPIWTGLNIKHAQSHLKTSQSWVRMQAFDRYPPSPAEFEQLVEDFKTEIEYSQNNGNTSTINQIRRSLAELYLRVNQPEAAQPLIEESLLGDSHPETHLLHAEVLSAQGNSSAALKALERAEEAASVVLSGTHYVWRILSQRAKAQAALNHRDEAVDSFQQAFEELQRQSRLVSFGGSRGQFFRSKRTLVEAYLKLLVSSMDRGEAFQMLVNAQSQVLRSIEPILGAQALAPEVEAERQSRIAQLKQATAEYDRASKLCRHKKTDVAECLKAAHTTRTDAFDAHIRWLDEHAPSQLPRPVKTSEVQASLGADEALMVLFPVDDAWHGFLYLKDGTLEHAQLETPEAFFTTWAPQLDALAHLYLSTGGSLQTKELHTVARPDGAPWATKLQMSYLPHPGHLLIKDSSTQNEGVLVAGNPERNLLLTPKRLPEIATRHLPSAKPIMKDEVTRDSLVERLPESSVFLYVGHGSSNCGSVGNCLSLAEDTSLEIIDVLSMPRGPNLALIMACHSGEGASFGKAEGLGLNDAFLAIGTRTMLVADGVVPEAEALDFVEAFLEAGGRHHPAKAYRAVVEQQHAKGKDSWKRFRVMGLR